ncbi:MAG: hypothetical protein JW917_03410 [Ignavibacteria bacterium]|nr:hypothetical protein [Ignavibacteria bacterium]
MYSENQKNEFALLRAEGVSFNSISKKLDVPIRTLFRWAKDMSGVISDLKIDAYESLMDSLKASVNKRIQSLIIALNNIDKNINRLGFGSIDTVTLMKMKMNIHNELLKYEEKLYFPDSVKKSQTVVPDVPVSDNINKSNLDERNQNESDKIA